MRASWLLFAGMCLVATAEVAPSQAQDVEGFYRGKQIAILVGSAAGSGYDLYARLLARHMGRHLAGNPTVIVQDMPGGGGLTAVNHLYNVAAKDGTVIGAVQRGATIAPLIQPEGVKYDVAKLAWLGSTNSETGVLAVWHTAPQQTIQDVMKTELLIGGSGPATDSETFPRVYNKTIGTRLRIISGYESTAPILLAMERGEVQGIGNSSWSNWTTSYAHYLEEKQVRILLQAGLQKHPDLSGVPMALDLARGPAERQILELYLASNTIGRPFVAPPGLPEARVAALRAAFDQSMRDPDLLAEAAKEKLDISALDGAYIQATLQRLFATPPDVVEAARKAILPDK